MIENNKMNLQEIKHIINNETMCFTKSDSQDTASTKYVHHF